MLENKQQLNTINGELNEALEFEIRNRLKSSDSIKSTSTSTDQRKDFEEEFIQTIYQKVNVLMQKLHAIGRMHLQQLDAYKQSNKRVKLPAILAEIYEIENGPKNVELNALASSQNTVKKKKKAVTNANKLVTKSNLVV